MRYLRGLGEALGTRKYYVHQCLPYPEVSHTLHDPYIQLVNAWARAGSDHVQVIVTM